VLPGRYRVRVVLGADTSEVREVEVRPDPRVEVPMDERRMRRALVDRGLAAIRRFTAAQQRVEAIREAVDELRPILRAQDDAETAEALETQADALLELLDEQIDLDSAGRYRRALFGLQSAWDAPGEGERLAVERMEAALEPLVAAVNEVLGGAFADFRRAVSEAGLVWVPDVELIERES
jgi:hypothetical protein